MSETSHASRLGNWVRSRSHLLAAVGATASLAMVTFAENVAPSDANVPATQGLNNLLTVSVPEPAVNKSEAVDGPELTSEHGFFLTLIMPGDSVTLVQENEKTVFVGVRRADEKKIRICGFASKWELEKFDEPILDPSPTNPCTKEDMNEQKNRYSFGEEFNGKRKVDGTFSTPVDLFDSRCKDPALYREYSPSKETSTNKYPEVKKGFDIPLRLANGLKATLTNIVHYRYKERIDEEAANVRIDPEDIEGLAESDRNKMHKWFWVRRVCLPDKIIMDGPDKPKNAVRGKNPISKAG